MALSGVFTLSGVCPDASGLFSQNNRKLLCAIIKEEKTREEEYGKKQNTGINIGH